MTIKERILSNLGLVSKKQFDTLRQQSAMRTYVAAQVNRLTADWTSYRQSIDSDVRMSLVIIRERARDLVKNNEFGRAYMRLLSTNIIGPTGFTLQMDVKNPDGTSDEPANALIEDAWRDWSERNNCSVSGQYSFRAVCDQLIKYIGRDGEGLLRPVFNKQSKYGLQTQVIEPEALDEQYSTLLTNGNVVKMGVEVDAWRRPITYYIRKVNPINELYSGTSVARDYYKIPASELIHGFDREYVNQTRGISWLVQSLFRMKQLSGYEEAVVVNARASAAKMIFLTRAADAPGESYTGTDQDAAGNKITSIEPGGIEELPIGMKPEPWDPKQPTTQHDMFMRTSLNAFATGVGFAAMSLSGDLSGANYSSMRAGLLPERDAARLLQQWFAETYLYPLFSIWLETAIMKGTINLPEAKFEKFNKPIFVGRTWDWVDPEKDTTAKVMALRSGLASPYDVAGEQGKKLEQIYKDIADANALAKKFGIVIDWSIGKTAAPVPAEPGAEAILNKARELVKSNNGSH
jgi:lambda family phage portal protein